MQSTARKNELPLDRMCLVCEVTKKSKDEVTVAPREGAYINGPYMEVGSYFYRGILQLLLCRFAVAIQPFLIVLYYPDYVCI